MTSSVLLRLPEESRETLQRYVKHMSALFGSQLDAVVLYGSAARGDYLPGRSNLNVLMVLQRFDRLALERYAKTHARWAREQLIPLFLSCDDLETGPAIFPLEYSDMAHDHVVMAGSNPLAGVTIDPRRLGWACEQELRGGLLRLRQRFVEGGGTTEAIAILIPLSVTSVLTVLRGVFRAAAWTVPDGAVELLHDAGTRLALDPVFHEAWNLKRGVISPGPVELPRLFDRYVRGLEQLIEQVAELRKEGRL